MARLAPLPPSEGRQLIGRASPWSRSKERPGHRSAVLPLRLDGDLDGPTGAIPEGGQSAAAKSASANSWVMISARRMRPSAMSGMTRASPLLTRASRRSPVRTAPGRACRCATPSLGMPTAAMRPPLRSGRQRPPQRGRRAGSLEDDVGAAAAGQAPDSLDRVDRVAVDTHEAHGSSAFCSRSPRPTTMTRPAPRARAASPPSRPTGPAPMTTTSSPGCDPATPRAVQRDRGRVDDGALLPADRLGQREDALDAVDDVLGVGALVVVTVLAMEVHHAVVLAQVVAALDALLADAAGIVAGTGHAVADGPAGLLGAGTQLDDLAGPLVAGDDGEGRRPEAGVVAGDEVRVGTADRHRLDAAEDLHGPRLRDGHLLDLEPLGLEHDEGLHGVGRLGQGRGVVLHGSGSAMA